MGVVNLYIHEPSSALLEIASEVREWRTPKVRLWVSDDDMRNCDATVRRIIGTWLDHRIVDQNVQVDNSVGYYEWDVSAVQIGVIASNGLKALVQRCMSQNMQFAVLGDSAKCKGRMTCFVDAPQKLDLPCSWLNCRWMTTYDEVLQFCHEQGVFDFDLSDTSRFCPTGKSEQGAPIYKELSTGNLIYLDNMHKTHYEVFSPIGRHLGEMSLNGQLDRLAADNRKRLDI